MTNRDFDFVASLANKFFRQTHIQKRLKLIEEKPITGWEIWFQVEFSVFLESQKSEDIAWWDREFQYSIDRRKANHREYMAIDFVFRKKRSVLGQYIALEIKQNTNVSSCIRGMMEDTCKVSLVKGSHDDLRSMWTLGIHPVIDNNALMNTIKEYSESFNVELIRSCIVTEPIKQTNLAYTIF
ncbi:MULTISPECIES: hypothetical protein [Vibrio]|jgi:hypothetical protein|uniref:hypothetical protein n=1 Tax=Vibrio TaxID=662 RepID=UPI00037F1924|nr:MULTISPECIES: hypothetical protein [Vibrio]OEF71025.1 hypothetical protein A152_15490 [Vibrio tasmaniensis 1F-187]PMN21165.1 hypothetical protein BCT41_22755 [Vibrio splendidus]